MNIIFLNINMILSSDSVFIYACSVHYRTCEVKKKKVSFIIDEFSDGSYFAL